MSQTVLIVDDDRSFCEALESGLQRQGYEVKWMTSGDQALQTIREEKVDVVVTDLKLGEDSGLRICDRIVANNPDVPVIVITAYGSMESAVGAMRTGAHDYITKPVDLGQLGMAVERAIQHRELRGEVRRLRDQIRSFSGDQKLNGKSAVMRQMFELIARVSQTDATVLISGESGTGKELVARAVHDQSERAKGPFVAINCAAVPPNLLESELFGHARGAFTDAKSQRDGLFVQATGGTLFLDEIGELPIEMQPKLLRVLQEHMVRPVGSDQETKVDVRIIAATNRNLEAEVASARFREDLYYRINVVRIDVPSLRERENDVLMLAQRFVEDSSQRNQKHVIGISEPAAKQLIDYDWPGNVRELENCIERAVTLTKFDHVMLEDLPEKVRAHQTSRLTFSEEDPKTMPTLEDLEKRYVQSVLKAVGGNKTHAAQVLGVDRRTLYRKLEKYAGA
jgi:DNA-binding NtrC family response regulator